MHSGGKKVIDAVRINLGLTHHDVRHTTGVLRDYGNLSSGSLLFSYERLLMEDVVAPGETAWNREQRFQETTDIELNAEGVAQARRAARVPAALAPDAVITSDLKRAAATARSLTALTRRPATPEAGLREAYTGLWQGLTHDEIVAGYGEEYEAWRRGEPVRRGGGELDTEVAERATAVVERHAERLPDRGRSSW